jgi:membrane-associated phospholipid phosphatase
MNKNTIFLIKLASLFAFIALAIGLEQVYRSPLFSQSIEWSKQWQESTNQYNFFKVITEFGTLPVFLPILAIIFLWSNLSKSFAFISVLIYSVYFNNLFKLIYGNPRPFWVDPSVSKACDGGFGNPSGHAMVSLPVYLAVWNLSTDFSFFSKETLGRIIKYIILVLFVGLTIAIILSRVYLGVHSVNQILYGVTLGFSIYFLIFHIFEAQKLSAKNFFNIFYSKKLIIIFSIWYFLLVVIALILFGFLNHDKKEWENLLNTTCPDLKPYRKFQNDALFGMLTIFVLIGAHFGLIFLVYMTKKKFPEKEEEILNWYLGSFLANIYRILFVIINGIPIILTLVIPGDLNLGYVYTFKVAVPYLISLFNIYGPCIYFSLCLGIGNKNVFSDKNKQINNNDQINKSEHLKKREELKNDIERGDKNNEIKFEKVDIR